MKHDVKAPSVGESITEVSILKWAKQNGEAVKSGELLLEIESDKATVEVIAPASGALTVLKPVGERIAIGTVIGFVDDAVAGKAGIEKTAAPSQSQPTQSPVAAKSHAPAPSQQNLDLASGPAAKKMIRELGIDASQIQGTGKRGSVTKGDILLRGTTPASSVTTTAPHTQKPAQLPDRPGDRRVTMSMLRAKIAERLVQAQHTAAILTTFNEADMGAINELRKKYKDSFKTKHGVSLGFMSFFTRASVEALKLIPEVNASIDGNDVIYHDYYDVGIAVGTDRGLVVPVLRNAEKMGFVDIEKKIAEYGEKAKNRKLSIDDMTGGTFTISNGGVYGSLMSTPILNPPQSGILGMHKIQERPMAVNGKVEIRPMMYLALSYDHRLIDGKGAVTFLVTLKDYLEHPEKLGLDFTHGL